MRRHRQKHFCVGYTKMSKDKKMVVPIATDTHVEERRKKLSSLVRGINEEETKKNKDAPALVIMASELPDPHFIKTGVPELDEDLGGGIARGAISTVWGSPNCGKTSIALMLTAELQKAGGVVIWVDTEDLDKTKAKAAELGVDMEALYVIQPNEFAEQALNTVNKLLFDDKTKQPRGLVDLIVVDSITNLVPKAIVDGTEERGLEANLQMGRRAAMVAKWVEMLQGKHMLGSGEKGTAMFVIAQERADPNTIHGDPMKMTGGKALPHASKVIIKLRKGKITNKKEGTGEQPIGHEINYSIEKQAVKGPPRKGSYSILYGIGVDDSQTVFAKAVDYGYVVKKDRKTFRFYLPENVRDIEGGIQEMRDLVKEDLSLKNLLKAQLTKGRMKEIPADPQSTEETT